MKSPDTNSLFGKDTEPKDQKFINLFKQGYTKEIPCYWGLIETQAIKLGQ